MLVEVFYTEIQPYFADVNKGCLDALGACPFAKSMGLSSIVDTADNETKDIVVEYLTKHDTVCSYVVGVQLPERTGGAREPEV